MSDEMLMGFKSADDVLAFVPKLRALGVVQFSGGGVSFALGPLPSDAPPTADTRKPTQDALSLALELRGTRPDVEVEPQK